MVEGEIAIIIPELMEMDHHDPFPAFTRTRSPCSPTVLAFLFTLLTMPHHRYVLCYLLGPVENLLIFLRRLRFKLLCWVVSHSFGYSLRGRAWFFYRVHISITCGIGWLHRIQPYQQYSINFFDSLSLCLVYIIFLRCDVRLVSWIMYASEKSIY